MPCRPSLEVRPFSPPLSLLPSQTTHSTCLPDSEGSTSSSDAAEEDEDPMAAYIRAERKKQKSSKKKKGEGKDSKEERRARKAARKARKADKKSNGKEREERVKREGSEDRKPRIRDTSRRTISRSRSPRRIPKREEEEEDTKPSRADLSRSREEIRPFTDRQRDRERRSRSPGERGFVKRERSPSVGDARYGRREEPRADRYSRDRSPRRERQPRDVTRDRSPRRQGSPRREREYRDAPRDRSPRRDSRNRDFDTSSRRRTDQDWRAGREEPLAIDDRAAEADYASWRGKRQVERVMKRVGGEREKRW
jgi:RNA-binding motif X-linked protein 2